MSDGPLVLGIETSCDETGVGIVRGNTLLADALAAVSTSTPGSAASCPRWPAAPTSRRWSRPSSGPARRPASGCTTSTRSPSPPARAWPARCSSASRPRRRWRSRSASRSTASTTSPPTSPSTSSSTARCPSRAWRCWSAAATPACSGSRTSPRGRPARRHHRRRGRRGVRQGRPAARACRSPAARTSTAPRAAAAACRRLPARAHQPPRPGAAPLRLLVLRAQDRGRALGRGARARRRAVPVDDVAASFQEAVCDVLDAQGARRRRHHGIEDLLIGGGVAANSRLRAMAEERAAAQGIRVRVPRPGLCTDNGAMVAALGAEMVARGRPRRRSTCPPTPRCR